MPLFVTVCVNCVGMYDRDETQKIRTVLGDVMKVIPSDNEGAGHLSGNYPASKDTPAY